MNTETATETKFTVTLDERQMRLLMRVTGDYERLSATAAAELIEIRQTLMDVYNAE